MTTTKPTPEEALAMARECGIYAAIHDPIVTLSEQGVCKLVTLAYLAVGCSDKSSGQTPQERNEMTTPNIEELIKQLRALGIPDWKTARWMMTEAADALQSQAERIKELERESETHAKAYGLAIVERDNLRAQLAESVSNHEACKSANSMLLETIAEIEKQEPVGYAYANQDFIGSVIGAKGEWAPREIALFTRPMPADVTELVDALEGLMHKDCGEPAFVKARTALSKYKGAK